MWTTKRLLFLCFFLGSFLLASKLKAQVDTSTFTYQDYLSQVLQHHPLARKARLNNQLAAARRKGAKGFLDPQLSSNWSEKSFDDKQYYRHFQSELRVPTQLGIDLVAGYENTDGIFLNPERTTDPYGLWNLGIEVNLLQGLLVNPRKTALEQAEVFQNMAENQQQVALNQLLLMASLAYLNWQQYHYFQQTINENIVLAQTYFNNTKASFFSGEKTAMDTLEALILFQDAFNLRQANEAALFQAQQQVENFLWTKETPLNLPAATIPQTYTDLLFAMDQPRTISQLINNHPLLLEKRNKRAMLEVEQRLKREKLKPKFKAKYYPLLATSEENLAPAWAFSNYKWGFDFSMPLLFRRERAQVEEGQIKILEVNYELENKQNELINQLETSQTLQARLEDQIAIQEQNVAGYRQLLDGENDRFLFGESSVFLLNKRQEKYLSGQLKLIELNIKLQKEMLKYWYYSNAWAS